MSALRTHKSLMILLTLSCCFSSHAEKQTKLKAFVEALRPFLDAEVLVKAVSLQNEKPLSQEKILELDKKWKDAVGIPKFMEAYLTSPCAQYLKALKKERAYVEELFVMDKVGGLVCSSDQTSDYWQGDEAKWQKSFNGGEGKDFYDEAGFDESSQAFLQQVSLPLKDKQGTTFGAVTIGFNLDAME